MLMRLRNGIKLLDEREGAGRPADKGDRIVYNLRIFLNKGDEVHLNERQAEYLPDRMIRAEGDHRLVNHQTTLGSRQTITGIEHSLAGMKPGGYRKVRVSPHLAYRDQGLQDLIPPNAVLIIELWLREFAPA
jgi:FKBP-type peptidyl-prolyl cis-trans isomerase (trigger factor)